MWKNTFNDLTYHNEKLIDVIWGHGLYDEISSMNNLNSIKNQEFIKEFEALWSKEEERLAKKHSRKSNGLKER